MKKMKIAVILPLREKFTPKVAGAIALTVKDFAYNASEKIDTTVYGHQQTATFNNIKYIPVKIKKFRLTSRSKHYVKQCIKSLKQKSFDIIEVHNRVTTALLIKKAFPSLRVILYLHNDPISIKGLKTNSDRERVAKQLDLIICVSEFIKKRFITQTNLSNISVVYNALTKLPLSISFEDKKPLITFIGRIVPEKGALILAKALVKVLPSYPEWRCVFIGASFFGSDRPTTEYEKEVERTLAQLGSAASYLNSQPNDIVMQYQLSASISAIPSVWEEPFGRTVLEAMASGCACISSRKGGIPEVVGDFAILLESVTEDSIAEALEKLLIDTELRSQLQINGKKHVDSLFNIETQGTTLSQLRYHLLN